MTGAKGVLLTVCVLLVCATGGEASGVQCDGLDDFLSAPNEASFDFVDTTFTVCFRMVTGTAPSSAKHLLSKGALSGGWYIHILTSGHVGAMLYNTAQEKIAERSTSTALHDGLLHSVCVVITTHSSVQSNNTMTVYLDGVLNQQAVLHAGTGGYTANATPVEVCRSSGNYYTGFLGDIMIISCDAGADFIKRYHTGGMALQQHTLPTVAYWPMDSCAFGASVDNAVFADRGSSNSPLTANNGANNTGMSCGSLRLLTPGGIH